MDIKSWLGGLFQKQEFPKVETKSNEIALPYVTGTTFGEWQRASNASPYLNNGTVRRSIDIMAFNLAQLPYIVYKDGVRFMPQADPNNVLIGSLLENPNETTSGFKFKLTHWSLYLLYDKVYWLLNRNPFGIIKEIYVLHPGMMKVVKNDKGEVLHYIYNQKLKIEKDDCIEFSGFNPTSTIGSGGSSIIETIRTELDTESAAAKYGKKFFENGTRLSGIITGNENTTAEDMQKVLSMWMENHRGETNAYKVGALLGGMKYDERGMTMRDAEFIEGRKEIKDRIIEAYGIPKSVYGLVDKIDRATADTQMRQFWQVTLKPLAILLTEDINTLLIRKNFGGFKVAPDFSVVEELKKDVNETAEAARKYFELGYSRNEVNERFRLGMDEEETGDTRYISSMLIEVGSNDLKPMEPTKSIDSDVVINKDIKEVDEFRSSFLKNIKTQEKTFESKIKRYLFEYRKDCIDLVQGKKASIDLATTLNSLVLLKLKQDSKIVKMMEPLYKETNLLATKTNYDLLKNDATPEVHQTLVNAYSNNVKRINKTINDKLKQQITEGINAGESVDQIVGRIKGVYNFTSSRAKMIARTESTNIYNATSLKNYKDSGVKFKKWLSASDDLVRDEHKANAAQGAIPINEVFASGEMYCSSVNCRCCLSGVIKGN